MKTKITNVWHLYSCVMNTNTHTFNRQMTSICFVCNLPIMSHQVGLVWQGTNGWDEMVREQVTVKSIPFYQHWNQTLLLKIETKAKISAANSNRSLFCAWYWHRIELHFHFRFHFSMQNVCDVSFTFVRHTILYSCQISV